jgi:hypothetical protein
MGTRRTTQKTGIRFESGTHLTAKIQYKKRNLAKNSNDKGLLLIKYKPFENKCFKIF